MNLTLKYNVCDFYCTFFKLFLSLKEEIYLTSQESCAFVRGLFTLILHLCNAGAELHGSLGQDSWLAEAQLPRCQSQEEFLPDAPGKWQICLLPHRQGIQVADHVLVQVGESAGDACYGEETWDIMWSDSDWIICKLNKTELLICFE